MSGSIHTAAVVSPSATRVHRPPAVSGGPAGQGHWLGTGAFRRPPGLLSQAPAPTSMAHLNITRDAALRAVRVRAQWVSAVTDATWGELVQESPHPVVVLFWASYSAPCNMVASFLDELALEYGSRIDFLKLDTEECPGVVTRYAASSLPMIMFFKDGINQDTVIGVVPKRTLAEKIEGMFY